MWNSGEVQSNRESSRSRTQTLDPGRKDLSYHEGAYLASCYLSVPHAWTPDTYDMDTDYDTHMVARC